MLRILLTTLALLISMTFIPAHAGNIVELENGTYVLESELPRVERKLDITVTKAAQAYPSAWKEALKTGEPVALETETVSEPAAGIEGLWRLNLNEVVTKSLVYDKAEGVLDVRTHDDPVIVERQRPVSPTAWAALAGALMLLSHLLVRMGIGGKIGAVAFAVATFVAAAAFAAAAFAVAVAFVAVAFVATFAAAAFAVAVAFVAVAFVATFAVAFEEDVRKHCWATSAFVVLVAVVGSSPWW